MNAAEHAAEAERLLKYAHEYTGVDVTTVELAIMKAQAHATLATIPDTYELTVETDEVRTDPAIRIGDRVVFLSPAESSKRNGRRLLGSDSLGTVIMFQESRAFQGAPIVPGARVDFDDIGEQWMQLDDLRVVLGA